MEEVTCHLLPFEVASGAHNMAADEVLLDGVRPGLALLRFYGWAEPTISLGYFQSASVRDSKDEWRALPFVRRPTGGGMLLHHYELTYALAAPLSEGPSAWLERMHEIIAEALGRLGVPVKQVKTKRVSTDEPLCFHQLAAGDLVCREAKIVGSAQRKRGNSLLQHGAVLLARSEKTPSLPGISEQAGKTIDGEKLAKELTDDFIRATQWTLEPREWTCAEKDVREHLAKERYGATSWNERR